MRNVAITLLFAVPVLAFGQASTSEIGPAPGSIRKAEQNLNQSRNSILLVDFSDGIPADWETLDEGGMAHWEYRGPTTDPDNTVGTIGSCASSGADSGPPQSETPDNGFVIFDSNFWDDPIGPCGNTGSGTAPGPHFAPFTTPSIDLSDYSNVAFEFHHLYKQWTGNSTVYVEMSIAGGDWTEIWAVDLGTANNVDELVGLNISDEAGGQSDVRIRWVFDGQYYWWMLDDIRFYEIPDYDLSMTSIGWGFFDVLSTDSFEGLEYSKYPDEMHSVLKPRARVFNAGANTQSALNVGVLITQTQYNAVIYNESAVINALSGQHSSSVYTAELFTPDVWGPYRIDAVVSGSQEEPSPINNIAQKTFWITDVEYVRDTLAMDGAYVPSGELFDTPYEVGNVFHMTGEDQDAHNISVGLSVGSGGVGTQLIGRVYSFNLIDGVNATLVGETELVTFSADDLNDMGEEKMVTLNFASPVPLTSGMAYVVTVGNEGGASDAIFSVSGDSPDWSSWAIFNGNQWGYLNATPMVRLNFGEVIGVEEVASQVLAASPFPNPATDRITLPLEHGNARLINWHWIDNQGRVVAQGQQHVHMGATSLEIETPSDTGWYSLRVETEGLAESHSVIVN